MIALGLITAASCTDPVSPGKKVATVSIAPREARIYVVGDSATFAVAVTTEAGTDGVALPVTWVVRDPSLLTVTQLGVAKSLRKGGSTYVVATVGGKADSALVELPLTPCGSLSPVALQIGQVATDIGASGFCAAGGANMEYTVLALNSSLNSAETAAVEVIGEGVGTPPGQASRSLSSRAPFIASTGLTSLVRRTRDDASDAAAREAGRSVLSPQVAAAQSWYRNRASQALRAQTVPAVGDLRTVNVSMGSSCLKTSRIDHTARVAAVSPSAIILDDQTNPAGGFTDAEYAAFATSFDTLVNPLDIQTFGTPTDLDNNGRVIILFTRAINDLNQPNTQTFIGGRTNSRDLFPTVSDGVHSGCDASNVAEIFYMLAPDPNGVVNGDKSFTKDFVSGQTLATIAHEYQHMINISRRMYLLGLSPDKWLDEIWLHEGLSHMAEELLFHRRSGLPTRTNIGYFELFASDKTLSAFNDDMIGDFFLYDSYATAPSTSSPYRQNDDVTTRGATWSFLRYAADRLGPTDGNLFFRLVNSGLLGLTNLETQLGQTPSSFQAMIRDFTISVYADDYAGVPAVYLQPSWDMRSIYPGFMDPTLFYPLVARNLFDNAPVSSALVAGGFAAFRFSAIPGTDALVRVTGIGGDIVPPGITLSVIRTR